MRQRRGAVLRPRPCARGSTCQAEHGWRSRWSDLQRLLSFAPRPWIYAPGQIQTLNGWTPSRHSNAEKVDAPFRLCRSQSLGAKSRLASPSLGGSQIYGMLADPQDVRRNSLGPTPVAFRNARAK